MKAVAILAIIALFACIHAQDMGEEIALSSTKPTGYTNFGAHGGCSVGWHVENTRCRGNAEYCSNYDSATGNCASCKWYAWWVKNDGLSANGTKTGNFCQNRWWFVLYIFMVTLILLNLIIGLIMYFCCKPKVPKPVPVVVEPEVEVHVVRPPRNEVRVERGEFKEWREQPVVREHRDNVHYGDRVLVETRYMSPGRDARVERHDHQDWAKYSQAHWHEH